MNTVYHPNGSHERSFFIENKETGCPVLYRTNDFINYRKYICDENQGICTEVNVDEDLFQVLKAFEKFIIVKDVDSFNGVVMPIYLRTQISDDPNLDYLAMMLFGSQRLKGFIKYTYLFSKKYDELWEFLYSDISSITDLSEKRYITIDDIMNIKTKCRNKSIDAITFFNIHGVNKKRLTKFGVANFTDIQILANAKLDEFEKLHGTNIVEYYFDKWCKKDISVFSPFADNVVEKYRNGSFKDGQEVLWQIGNYRKEKRRVIYHVPTTEFDWITSNGVFDSFFGVIAETFLRELENILREESQLPKTGEGWLAETCLYNLVRSEFNNSTVLHHGRPQWLGRQHLDVYLPEHNIALEYQGKQHDIPVEYFGGIQAFEHQQRLDLRKKEKCQKNGCRLLHIREGYSEQELLKILHGMIDT